mgnify:CR=1 FL=1
MNKLFESALARTNFDAEGGVGAWTPVADVYEDAEKLVFCLSCRDSPSPTSTYDSRMTSSSSAASVRWIEARRASSSTAWNARTESSFAVFVCARASTPASVAAAYHDGVLVVTLAKKRRRRQEPDPVVIR